MILIGLMSGTSLDGISAAVVRFDTEGTRHRAELLGHDVLSYTADERRRLTNALSAASPEEYCRLNFDVGESLARAAQQILETTGIAPSEIAAIASHGQTVWHDPGHSTWQIGEAAVIAERTGLPVISDFRVRDVAAGGQGAPLVPIADALLFASHTGWRALQNLGGIGNVTAVPPGGALDEVRAFDTGPGVVVIDGVTRIVAPQLPYDIDGKLARRGNVIYSVVRRAMADDYFFAPPPKSTGRELFTPRYIAQFVEWCRTDAPQCSDADLVATAVHFTAESIADAYSRFIRQELEDVVLSGGGARNPALVSAIREALGDQRVELFSDLFFNGEAKEAVAFALMGYLHLRHEAGNVPGATGAVAPRILGKLTPA